MKQISINKTLLIFTLLFIFFSCENKKNNEALNEVVTPSQIISIDQAVEMKDAYLDSLGRPVLGKYSTEEVEFDPTLFAFIELDSLKQYVKYLEEVEKLNDKKISGIRIYFAAYPNKEVMQSTGKAPKYKGKNTFFFAPTMEVEPNEWGREYPNLRNIPFYIESTGQNKLIGTFKAIDRLLCKHDSRTTNTKDTIKETVKTSLILNDLQITPPPN